MKWKPEKMYYIFSNESCSYSQETKFPKTFFIFQETELSDIPGNGTPPKKLLLFHDTELSYITRSNFPSMKNMKNPL